MSSTAPSHHRGGRFEGSIEPRARTQEDVFGLSLDDRHVLRAEVDVRTERQVANGPVWVDELATFIKGVDALHHAPPHRRRRGGECMILCGSGAPRLAAHLNCDVEEVVGRLANRR